MFKGNTEFDQPLGSGGGVSGWDVSSVLFFEECSRLQVNSTKI
jgi:hypothetical protein